jgi:hypothetical protein
MIKQFFFKHLFEFSLFRSSSKDIIDRMLVRLSVKSIDIIPFSQLEKNAAEIYKTLDEIHEAGRMFTAQATL